MLDAPEDQKSRRGDTMGAANAESRGYLRRELKPFIEKKDHHDAQLNKKGRVI